MELTMVFGGWFVRGNSVFGFVDLGGELWARKEPRTRTRDEDESDRKWIEGEAPAYSVGPRRHLRTASAALEMDR